MESIQETLEEAQCTLAAAVQMILLLIQLRFDMSEEAGGRCEICTARVTLDLTRACQRL